ncbi:hypothetical protein BC940DRAFT_297165 [Gongronella butleri]|nr:hypothetical protein BC940DRAFT_297165 [Gongronella butleri]
MVSSQSPTLPMILQKVMTDPKLLADFEAFLAQTWSQENLLFVEAMTQLRHEEQTRNIEPMLHRIFKTFLIVGAPMELNVTTQERVRQNMAKLQWTIIDKATAIDILYETEAEVLSMLHGKLSEYIQAQQQAIPSLESVPRLDSSRIRVCIVGGGFVGFTVASILDAMPVFHVTLIDTKASFEYTPGILKKLVDPHGSTSLRVNHTSYVRNGQVIIGRASEIDEDASKLLVNDEWISFNYLVMGTGSSYNGSLKSTDISTLYRMTGLEETYVELLAAESILIIGGGLVGCELASEICQTTFPGAYPKKNVTIVDANNCIVHRSSQENQQRAYDFLTQLGVTIVTGERITEFETADACNLYIGSSGRQYAGYDKVFLTTGTVPNSGLFVRSPTLSTCVDPNGRIKVRPTLQIDHWRHKHIFAGGDVTNVTEEKTGYAATLAGVCIARNICRLVKGKKPLQQGAKGTLAAPSKPLHGDLHHGGIGKQKLGTLKKAFSFLNHSWAALKYFDELQFLELVQGQRPHATHGVIGRLPRQLSFNELKTQPLPVDQDFEDDFTISDTSSSDRSQTDLPLDHHQSLVHRFIADHYLVGRRSMEQLPQPCVHI